MEIIIYNNTEYTVVEIDIINNTTHLIDKQGNGIAVNTFDLK